MIRTEEMVLNWGPQHSATQGTLRFVLKLDGETIVSAQPVIGYLHRGTEKLAESLQYHQIIPYTDRLDFLSAMMNNYVFCHAVETMMEIEVPERAELIRVLAMELNRIASHLTWFGTFMSDLGAVGWFHDAFLERELVLNLLNALTGARVTFNYMRIGGVKWDVPTGWLDQVRDWLPALRERLADYYNLTAGNEMVMARLKGLGVYSTEDALAYSLSGVNLRCTGLAVDARKTKDYSLYKRFDFQVVTRTAGDVYSRLVCRLREIEESLKIAEQVLEQFPAKGEIIARVPKAIRPPAGEVFVSIESSRGELGCYIASDGKKEPQRVKFRRPSFHNLQIVPKLLKGHDLADLATILGAMDLVVAEVDG